MLLYTPSLVTLDAVKRHRRLSDAHTKDDELLVMLISAASAAFQQAVQRVCAPYWATHTFDYGGQVTKPYTLDVGKAGLDLLDVTTLTNGDGSPIAANKLALRTANMYPKWRIEIKQSAGTTFTYNNDWQDAISVQGWWGYVPNYLTCWQDSTVDVPGGGMTASATSITLTQADAARIDIGAHVKVDDEIVFVTARDATSISITRGQLGTTAASHNAGAALNVFVAQPDISDAVREMVVYSYKSIDRVGGRVTVFEGGAVTMEDMDRSVADAIVRHRRAGLRVI